MIATGAITCTFHHYSEEGRARREVPEGLSAACRPMRQGPLEDAEGQDRPRTLANAI